MPARTKAPTVPVLSSEVAIQLQELRRFYATVETRLDVLGAGAPRPHIAVCVGVSGPRYAGLPESDTQRGQWGGGSGLFLAAELFRSVSILLRRTEERLAVTQ